METRKDAIDAPETTVDQGKIFAKLLSELPTILLTAAVGALLAYLISASLIVPKYSSTTKLYVMANEEQTEAGVDNGTLQAGALLTKDYEQIIESREVTEAVIVNLKLPMTQEELIRKLTVTVPDETRIVNITVTDSDPYQACDIANAVRSVAEDRIQSIMDMKTVKVVEEANIPIKPESPNKLLYAAVGGLAGMLLAMGMSIIQLLSDTTIRTSEDIQTYLGVSVLAVIPLAEGMKNKGKKKSKLRNRHSKRIEKQ